MNALSHSRYPWTEADERFLISAKRHRFGHKDIAFALQRSKPSVDMMVKRLSERGVLVRHRKEELELLDRMLAEAAAPETQGAERK